MELPNTNKGHTDPIPSGHDDEDTPEKRTEAAARLIGLMDEHLVGETVEGPESWRKASLAERLILTERPYGHDGEDLRGYQVLEGHLLFRYDENTETGMKQYQISRIPNRHLRGKDADQLTITQDADGVIEAFHPKEDRDKERKEATTTEIAAMGGACFSTRVTLYDFDEEKEMMTTHPHYRALVRIQRKTLVRKIARVYTDLREGRTSDEYR